MDNETRQPTEDIMGDLVEAYENAIATTPYVGKPSVAVPEFKLMLRQLIRSVENYDGEIE